MNCKTNIKTTRLLCTLLKGNNTYNLISQVIGILIEDKNLDNFKENEHLKVEDIIINRIYDFISDNKILESQYENIRAYADIIGDLGTDKLRIKSIDIYMDYDKSYVDIQVDKLFDVINSIPKPQFIIKPNYNIDTVCSSAKEHNEKTVKDILNYQREYIENEGVEISRLSAIFKLNIETKEDVVNMIKCIMGLDIKPIRVLISEGIATLDYEPKQKCFVDSIKEYENVLYDFVNYINSVNEIELYLDDNFIYDYIEVSDKSKVKSRVSFDKDTFNGFSTQFDGYVELGMIEIIL